MMSAKAAKRPLRSLTAHEKLEAIRRVHDGESKASVARDIGVPESTLRGWCKNEEKISYISRQSSPDTDDSIHGVYEPKEKKIKLEDSASPFNLSLKPRSSYSPTGSPVDYTKTDDKPINLKTDATPKAQTLSERERNRAELARLSIELGLNRPEMYTGGAALGDISSNIGLLTQWNNLLLQQTQQMQRQQQKKVTAPADTSSNASTAQQPPQQQQQPTSASLLTTYKTPTAEKSPKLPKVDPPKSVEDSVWYWLKTQQAMLGLTQNQVVSNNIPTSTSGSSSIPTAPAPTGDQNSSWFWKWYKQYTQASQQLQQHHQQQQQQQQQQLQPATNSDKQILYQQLTKEKDSENLKIEEKPKTSNNTNKARAVLDNLLLNNNNNVAVNGKKSSSEKDPTEEDLTQSEALEHGEKFLKWLECCSEPSVTAMQIMQFRGLINNIRNGADRKNGDSQKTKVRRK